MHVLNPSLLIRPLLREDYTQWRPLWDDSYNAFYGRTGSSALPSSVIAATWERFFDAAEEVHAIVAEDSGRIVGFAHYLFHLSTTRLQKVCLLHDLFTLDSARGRGVGTQLILALYDIARAADSSRVYWQTQVTNSAARALYDKVAAALGFIVYTHDLG